jgi:hypothetical protein
MQPSSIAPNPKRLNFNDAPLQSEIEQRFTTPKEGQPTLDELRQRLHSRLREALRHLFPAGRIEGQTFMIGNLQGHEGKSLKVELSGDKAGLWHDFATGEGGDLFDLWAAVHGWDAKCNFPEIMGSVQEWLGLPSRPLLKNPANKPGESWGRLTAKWHYLDPDGQPIACVSRYDNAKGKTFRLWDVKTQKWQAPNPRPLYNLPGIARSDAVILVEGEKCAEALINQGICATTAMGGANAPVEKTDWSPLRGKHVLIWPDQDAPGKEYAARAIQKLGGLGLASLALLIIPEDKPEKWDAADAVAEGMDMPTFLKDCPRTVLSLSEAKAEAPLTTEPLPLRKQLEKARDYPIDALGDLLGGAALDIYDQIQAPLAICAQSVLASAALAIQTHIDIRLPFGQTSPVSLFMITISESGCRKSCADKEASAFITQREAELKEKNEQSLLQYKNAKDVWDALRRQILNDKSGKDQQTLESELNRLGDPPKPPTEFLLTSPEPTYEGICGYYINGQPSIGLYSDEGGQFLSGHGMNSDNKIKTAAGLCTLWGAGAIKRMRGGDGTIVLIGKRLSLHLLIQPGVVDGLLSDPELLQQGLLSRLLVVFPPHLFGTRFSTTKKVRDGRAVKDFNDKMLDIVRKELPVDRKGRNELSPRILEMTPEAQAAFYKFSDAIELRIKDGGDMESIRGFCSKLAEQASRIGAIIAFAEDPGISHLQKHHFDRGAVLAEYYAQEALRLLGNDFVPSYILDAEALLAWLKDVWPPKTSSPCLIALSDVCRLGPNKTRRKEPAMRSLKILEDHGWLVKEPNGIVIDGKYRKDVWRIRREFLDAPGETQEGLQAAATPGNPGELAESISSPFGSQPNVSSPSVVLEKPDAAQWEGMNI